MASAKDADRSSWSGDPPPTCPRIKSTDRDQRRIKYTTHGTAHGWIQIITGTNSPKSSSFSSVIVSPIGPAHCDLELQILLSYAKLMRTNHQSSGSISQQNCTHGLFRGRGVKVLNLALVHFHWKSHKGLRPYSPSPQVKSVSDQQLLFSVTLGQQQRGITADTFCPILLDRLLEVKNFDYGDAVLAKPRIKGQEGGAYFDKCRFIG